MIGVVLCTHSDLAQGFKNAINMIAGEQKNFDVICFMNGDDLDELKAKMFDIVKSYEDKGDHCVIMTDLFAATPFNTGLKVALETSCSVISGVNLPLLLDVLLSREGFDGNDLESFLNNSLDNVKESMKVVSKSSLD